MYTPFHLSNADLYIIILPSAELLYIKGDLSVKSNSCLITLKDADHKGRHLKCKKV